MTFKLVNKKTINYSTHSLPTCEVLLAALFALGEFILTGSAIRLVLDLIRVVRLDGVAFSSATSPGVSDTMLVFDLILVLRRDGVTALSSTGSATSFTVDFLVLLGAASGAVKFEFEVQNYSGADVPNFPKTDAVFLG